MNSRTVIHAFRLVLVIALLRMHHQCKGEAYSPYLDNPASDSNAAFGIRLFTEMASINYRRNILFSPVGTEIVLYMAANGARGQTAVEVKRVLHIGGMPIEKADEVMGSWLSSLRVVNTDCHLTLASSLWCNAQFPISPRFVETNRRFFDSDVYNVDFENSTTVDKINSWVSGHTDGKITKIIESKPSTRLITLSAIDFRANWLSAFRTNLTRDRPFILEGGEKTYGPRMFQCGRFQYLDTADFQLLALPYASKFKMYIFLPRISMRQFLKDFSFDGWRHYRSHMMDYVASVQIPRFDVRCEADLKPALKNIGMHFAFEPSADFSGISEGVWISDFREIVSLKVDEAGTELSAVNLTGYRYGSERQAFFIADHPFVIVICDDKGSIVLLGAIMNPHFG